MPETAPSPLPKTQTSDILQSINVSKFEQEANDLLHWLEQHIDKPIDNGILGTRYHEELTYRACGLFKKYLDLQKGAGIEQLLDLYGSDYEAGIAHLLDAFNYQSPDDRLLPLDPFFVSVSEKWIDVFSPQTIKHIDKNGRLPQSIGKIRTALELMIHTSMNTQPQSVDGKKVSAETAAGAGVMIMTAVEKKRIGKRRQGRKQVYDPIADTKLISDWHSSGQTKRIFETSHEGVSTGDVQRAIDRQRKQ